MNTPASPPPAKRPNYFAVTAALVGAMATVAVWQPQLLTGTIAAVSEFVYLKFDWLIMWLPLLAFGVGLAVALSPCWGKIRLGGADAKPDYPFAAWMNMLFTAGIGVGIVFFGRLKPCGTISIRPSAFRQPICRRTSRWATPWYRPARLGHTRMVALHDCGLGDGVFHLPPPHRMHARRTG